MSESFLSQEEVDALLEGVTGESQKLDAEEVFESGEIRNYDISSQERIVRGRMPTMEVVNERFARNFRIGLFNFIRKSPEISIGTASVQRYSAFLRELAVPTNFNIMAIRPLRGSGLVVCDPALVFGVIDTLYGGAGKFHTRIEGRDFSLTEQRVIDRLVEVIVEEYRKAWHGIYPLELDYQRSEMQPQFANIATPSEIVVATSFQLEIGDTAGAIHICMPYSTLEPIRDVLYSATQGDSVESTGAGSSAEPRDPVGRSGRWWPSWPSAGHRRAAAGHEARRFHRARPSRASPPRSAACRSSTASTARHNAKYAIRVEHVPARQRHAFKEI
jgi:flagellar motor switch protein FliM